MCLLCTLMSLEKRPSVSLLFLKLSHLCFRCSVISRACFSKRQVVLLSVVWGTAQVEMLFSVLPSLGEQNFIFKIFKTFRIFRQKYNRRYLPGLFALLVSLFVIPSEGGNAAQVILAGDPDLRLSGGVHRTVFATSMQEFSLLELRKYAVHTHL